MPPRSKRQPPARRRDAPYQRLSQPSIFISKRPSNSPRNRRGCGAGWQPASCAVIGKDGHDVRAGDMFLEFDPKEFFVKGTPSREAEWGNFKPAKRLGQGSVLRQGYWQHCVISHATISDIMRVLALLLCGAQIIFAQ